MRVAVLWVVLLVACDDADPPKPESCSRVCADGDLDCTTFSRDQLPARCQEVCAVASCCMLIDGDWTTINLDCARASK